MEKLEIKHDSGIYLEKLQRGISCIVNFLQEVGKVTNKQLEYYKYPQYIYRGISKFYPYQSKDGMNHPSDEKVLDDTIRSGLSVRLDSYKDNSKPEMKPYIRANYVNILRDMIKTAKRHFPEKYPSDMNDLDVLADIQHNGGATCLVDFSKNVLTALWFACSADKNADGFVYCYDIMRDIIVNDCLAYIKNESLPIEKLLVQTYRETNICSDVDTRFCIWEPSSRNNRIIRQDSVFVFGMEKFVVKDHGISVVRISNADKECVLLAMETLFNISEDTIFNDPIGYANANRKMSPYKKLEVNAYTRGFDDMINGNYEAALEFLKLYEGEQNKAEMKKMSREELIELHFSLAVCYKHISRADGSIRYEENAVLEYWEVIRQIKKMFRRKISDDMRRDYYIRKCTRAYNGIFDMLYNMKQYERAIEKCDILIQDIENGILKGQKVKTLPMNKELSPIYCKITKMELLDLQLIKELDNCNLSEISTKFPSNRIIVYGEEALGCLPKEENDELGTSDERHFDKLLIDYYTLVYDVLIMQDDLEKEKENKEQQNIKMRFAKIISRMNILFSTENTNPYNSYILWNFAEIKKGIENLKLDNSSFKKVILQSATAQIIAFRDEFEVQSLRNLQDY